MEKETSSQMGKLGSGDLKHLQRTLHLGAHTDTSEVVGGEK